MSGGTVCVRLCNPPHQAVSLHALPALWPGLILGLLCLALWLHVVTRRRDEGMEVIVEFEPWDDDE